MILKKTTLNIMFPLLLATDQYIAAKPDSLDFLSLSPNRIWR